MTIAETIARALGDDGTRYEDDAGRSLDELGWNARATVTRADGATRYEYPDGSAIIDAGAAWDLALDPVNPDRWCWDGAGEHAASCPARTTTDDEMRDTLRQMLADWDRATPAERAAALREAARRAEEEVRR